MGGWGKGCGSAPRSIYPHTHAPAQASAAQPSPALSSAVPDPYLGWRGVGSCCTAHGRASRSTRQGHHACSPPSRGVWKSCRGCSAQERARASVQAPFLLLAAPWNGPSRPALPALSAGRPRPAGQDQLAAVVRAPLPSRRPCLGQRTRCTADEYNAGDEGTPCLHCWHHGVGGPTGRRGLGMLEGPLQTAAAAASVALESIMCFEPKKSALHG